MASVYDKYYEQQPAAVKIIVVAGLGLLGYTIYRSIRRSQDEKDAAQAAQAASAELQSLANQGVRPSYNDSQYYVFVNQLVQSMAGCGTDEDQVFQVFQSMNNSADIRKLLIAFGVQYYQPCAWTSPVSYAVWQINDRAYGGDLATWLSYDLSAGDIAHINSILSSKGIDLQF